MRRALPTLALAALGFAATAAWSQTAPAGPTSKATTASTALPTLNVAFTPQPATVGDRVEAVLTLRTPAVALVGPPRFPAWQGSWGDAEIEEKAEPRKVSEEAGVATWSQRLVLSPFRTGAIPLPPVAIALPGKERTVTLQTPATLTLNVRSVLPAAAKSAPGQATAQPAKAPEPKPAAPLRPLPVGTAFWASLAIGLLLVAAGIWELRRRERARSGKAAVVPALSPLPELLAELDRLPAERSAVAAHTRLSLALRRYLGRTLSFRAVESTTSEVQRLLLSRRVPGPLARRTVELLRACDMVKFAREEVVPERIAERVDAVRRLAPELDSQLTPPPNTVAGAPERLKAAG